jgi:taurine dioxygenase
VPDVGGDTLWCDMTAAYDALSPSMKKMLDGLVAVHSIEALSRYTDPDTIKRYLEEFPPQEHPVIRTHPETGKQAIYVNGAHTRRIKGLSPIEEAGSIAFWDNRSTQHYASADYFPQERFMDRVTVKGDRPF